MRRLLFLTCLLAAVISSSAFAADKVLMMATTTSTADTGLLDYLAPLFQKDTGIEVKWTAVGTGKALEMGKNCDVDVLLVHSPSAEAKFIEAGSGIERTQLMYNDFVLVGPVADAAKAAGKSVDAALKGIAAAKSPFLSRGDKSGTHNLEVKLWEKSGMAPDKESWYVSTGQGMLRTIAMAAEMGGYTVTDRGTWIKYESTLKGAPVLKIIVEGDKSLLNQYSGIVVNPAQCPKVKADLAREYIKWMASPAGQKYIGDFLVSGKPLFTPNAGK
ncbi:substrate-binding domain-containing protein [Nitratidesulfovibrio vulgaris]|uniref:ABC transporter, periplasmic substrate-binding protein n=1 Tax=Nitratidesulfovibrio vulgaris (strain DP4) TaxID=391774 RepID=A0A0H3AAC6_NITV4|nr:substrate-binding domain-containing protein [Nitratidesulfovibrio vulgaris]ABM29241.1 ABC transporter, periplasmic substrate-binding protein [Nitratidesulfovibrio vulgaris DP4]GEB79883.1 tungsten ABC transporter substrate-binding protein [Desulfovibrio desulfuricans]